MTGPDHDDIVRSLASARTVRIVSTTGVMVRYGRIGITASAHVLWVGPDGFDCTTHQLAERIARALGFGCEIEYFPAGTAR